MRFRTKIVLGTVSLMSILFGIGSTALVSCSFSSALEQEEETAKSSYRMTLTTLQILNESDSWSTEEGISRVLKQLAEESSWEAIRLTVQTETTSKATSEAASEATGKAASEAANNAATEASSEATGKAASEAANNAATEASSVAEDSTTDNTNAQVEDNTAYGSEGNILYIEGTYADTLTNLSAQADETHLAYTVIAVSEDCYYLQVSGACMLGNTLAYLDIAYDITSIYNSRQLQRDTYIRIFILLLASCAAASYLLAFFLTRPLTRLSKATRRIADGNYQYRSNIRNNDEIGRLSRDFDQMAKQLEDRMEQMQETVDQLQKTMTQLQESMEQQNRFVGNFTHELKTPMTSIIGYADLLRRQNLSEEERSDAANYIYKEASCII